MARSFGDSLFSVPSFSWLVIGWKQDRRCRTVALVVSRLGDDPEFCLAVVQQIGRKNPAPVLHGLVVARLVFLVNDAPITGNVARQKLPRVFFGLLQRRKSARCCN